MAGFRLFHVLVCGAILCGCSVKVPVSTETAGLEAGYAALWSGRESRYGERSDDDARGALSVLKSFRDARAKDSSPGEAERWLRRRHAGHRARLLELGLTVPQIEALVSGTERIDGHLGAGPEAKSVAYNIGAVAETFRIYAELVRLKNGRKAGPEGETATLPPAGNAGAFTPLVRGVMSGVGNVFGFR